MTGLQSESPLFEWPRESQLGCAMNDGTETKSLLRMDLRELRTSISTFEDDLLTRS